MHRRVVGFLTTSFDVLFAPAFRPSGMVRRGSRRPFKSDVARALLSWSHFEFRQHLEQRAAVTGCRVLAVSEAHSTRTCSCCGVVNPGVGPSKVFHCVNTACRAVLHRDVNASRNIFLMSRNLLPAGSVRLHVRRMPTLV
jgi:putative transposase